MRFSISRGLRVAAGALVVLAIALVALIAVNQFDEDLSPPAKAYFESGGTRELEAASGFALVIGLSAPVDQDPRLFAVQWSASMAAAARDRKPYPVMRDTLHVRAAAELLCQPEEFDCAERFGVRPDAIADLAADNAVLLHRYRELRGQADLEDRGIWTAFDAPVPDYSTVLATQTVFLSQVAAGVARGDVEAALRELEADAAFYRRWLGQGSLLVSKMVAVRGLSRDLILSVQLARRVKALTAAQGETLRRIAVPLSRTEWAIGKSLRFEAAGLRTYIEIASAGRVERRNLMLGWEHPLFADLLGLGLLPNATLNFMYPYYAAWQRLDATDTRDLVAEIARIRAQVLAQQEPRWNWLYDFGGKHIVAAGLVGMDQYLLRIRDVDAYATLACASFDVMARHIAPEAVEPYLATSSSACRDPYTGRPFRWDAASQSLWFEPGWAGSAKRLGGADGRVTVSPYPATAAASPKRS